jgi:hypothetical protein
MATISLSLRNVSLQNKLNDKKCFQVGYNTASVKETFTKSLKKVETFSVLT